MRRVNRGLQIVLGVLVVLVTVNPSVEADYLGDHCWQLTSTKDEWTGTMQLGLFHLGGNHLFISGIHYSGSATLSDAKLHMTLTSAGGDATSSSHGIYRMVLDVGKFSGTYNGIFTSTTESSIAQTEFRGVMDYIPCP